MLAVLEHLSYPEDILKEIHRVLKKDGRLIITVPSKIAKPILEFLSYKMNVIDRLEIEDHKKYYNKKDTQKAFSFEITDKTLVSKTGGIVQGMSGSPIIQNDKIIGAVTNVLVDNVTLGYGISIITMLEEGEN